MKVGIIGSGNVGSALANGLIEKHEVVFGVRDPSSFKGQETSGSRNIPALDIKKTVELSEVIILATPAGAVKEVVQSLGDTTGKIIIDAMNTVPPQPYVASTASIILENTQTRDVVKCFNTVGANVLANPKFGNDRLELYVAGDSLKGKEIAKVLCLDLGFSDCIDIGGNDRFLLMEQFAFFWINLAMFRKKGRDIGFKLIQR